MLLQTLRGMEASGLVARRVRGTVPPAVDDALTALGRRFLEPIDLLYDRARRNADTLDAAIPPDLAAALSGGHFPEPAPYAADRYDALRARR